MHQSRRIFKLKQHIRASQTNNNNKDINSDPQPYHGHKLQLINETQQYQLQHQLHDFAYLAQKILPSSFNQYYQLIMCQEKTETYQLWIIKPIILNQDHSIYYHMKTYLNIFQNSQHALQILKSVAILRQLNHPNIIKIKDIFVGHLPEVTLNMKIDSVSIITEYYDLTLRDIIPDLSHLPTFPTQDNIYQQLLQVLTYLSKKNIIHRNLTPDNIYVTQDYSIILSGFDFATDYQLQDSSIHDILDYLHSVTRKRKLFENLDHSKKKEIHLFSRSQLKFINHNQEPTIKINSQTTDIEETESVFSQGRGLQKPKYLNAKFGDRNYRAPEVALLCTYDFKIDYWSLGCIYAEMLLQEQLFDAQCCFPLSPLKKVEPNQNLIFQQLSLFWNSVQDLDFIKDADTMKYIKKLKIKQGNENNIFEQFSEEQQQRLKDLLQLNPNKRRLEEIKELKSEEDKIKLPFNTIFCGLDLKLLFLFEEELMLIRKNEKQDTQRVIHLKQFKLRYYCERMLNEVHSMN